MERVDLTREHGKDRVASWRHGWEHGPFVTVVSVGTLADGRWYAERHGRGANRWDLREGACVYAGAVAERLARATATRWMRSGGGEWVVASGRATDHCAGELP